MKDYQNKGRRAGIITWYNHGNCGGTLQAYALQTILNRMGIEVVIINNQDGAIQDFFTLIKYFIGKLMTIAHLNCHVKHCYPFLQFNHDNLKISKRLYNYKELENIVGKLDYIICGSDQIWAPNVFTPEYMANFISGDKIRKISYAASIGLNNLPDTHKGLYAELLEDFYKISVREITAKNMLEKYCGVNVEVLPDPTLLLNIEDYIRIEKKIYRIKKPYIFCYFLNKEHQYKDNILKFIGKERYVVGFSKNQSDVEWMNNLADLGPGEFIWLIRNADMVFTDSYHGTIFSLLFHKEFYTFERFSIDDSLCQNSRLEQLKYVYGIDSRIVKVDSGVAKVKLINYTEFENIREIKKDEAISFFRRALE